MLYVEVVGWYSSQDHVLPLELLPEDMFWKTLSVPAEIRDV
jgi:hypothetical protein